MATRLHQRNLLGKSAQLLYGITKLAFRQTSILYGNKKKRERESDEEDDFF
jgi:hypothetical protein